MFDPSQFPPINANDLYRAQNISMNPAPMSGAQSPWPAMMGTTQPIQMPQTPQIPPQLQHITDVLNQYTQNKQDQQSGNNFLTQILSNRMQPADQDTSRSLLNSALTNSYSSPDQEMAGRIQAQLSPFSQGLDLQNKSAEVTGRNLQNNITAQTGLPMAMAQVQKEQMANDIMAKTGMSRAEAETALVNANVQKQGIENQFLPQMQQADILAKRASAGFLGGGLGGTPDQSSALHGDDYLKNLPPLIANQVKALADGRMPFPSGFAMKSPYWQQMLSAVSQYDPNFDAINFASRQKTRQSFTSGADANNITALNTALAHLGTLSNNYKTLDNTNFPAVNSAVNYIGNQIGVPSIQTNTANVGADSEAVAHELAKVFRSTGMSEGEINAWKDKISTSAAPAQSQAVINSALDLIDGRLSALGEKYNQGMSTTKQPLDLLSPDAQKAYNSLRGLVAKPAQSTQTPTISSPNDPVFQQLPSGAQFMTPDGQTMVKH